MDALNILLVIWLFISVVCLVQMITKEVIKKYSDNSI